MSRTALNLWEELFYRNRSLQADVAAKIVIPKPPCPRTFPTEYRVPCNFVPTGKAGVDITARTSGEPHEPHVTLDFRFSKLQLMHRIEGSR